MRRPSIRVRVRVKVEVRDEVRSQASMRRPSMRYFPIRVRVGVERLEG